MSRHVQPPGRRRATLLAVTGVAAGLVVLGGAWLARSRPPATVALPAQLGGYARQGGGPRYAGPQGAFRAMALRSALPPLHVAPENLMASQIMRPLHELRRYGQVSCELRNDPLGKGRRPPPRSTHAVRCRRSGPHLSVELRDISGPLGNRPQAVAALVQAAWRAVS